MAHERLKIDPRRADARFQQPIDGKDASTPDALEGSAT